MLNFELNIQENSIEKIKVFFNKVQILSKKLHQIQYPNSTEFLRATSHIASALNNLTFEHLAQTQPNFEKMYMDIQEQRIILQDLQKRRIQEEQKKNTRSYFAIFFDLFKKENQQLKMLQNMEHHIAQSIENLERQLSHSLMPIILNAINQSLEKLFLFYLDSIIAPLEQNQNLSNEVDVNLLSILLLIKKQFSYFLFFTSSLQGTRQTLDLIKNAPYFSCTVNANNKKSYLEKGIDFVLEQPYTTHVTSSLMDMFFLNFDAFIENFEFFYINLCAHPVVAMELQKNVNASLTEFYISQNFSYMYPLAPLILDNVNGFSQTYDEIIPQDFLDLFNKLSSLALASDNFLQASEQFMTHHFEAIGSKFPTSYFKNSLESQRQFVSQFIVLSELILSMIDDPLLENSWDARKIEQLARAIHAAKNRPPTNEVDIQHIVKTLYRGIYQLKELNVQARNKEVYSYVLNYIEYTMFELNTILFVKNCLYMLPLFSNAPELIKNILLELGTKRLHVLIKTHREIQNKIRDFLVFDQHISPGILVASQTQASVRQIDKILFLYSSGGSGHEQAMRAHVQIAKDKEHNLPINYQPLKIDLMLDFLSIVGQFAIDSWNNAQKAGDIEKQEQLVAQQVYANYTLGPIIFLRLYRLLKDHPQIETIINTQAMCTAQICQAVLRVNQEEKRNIKIRLIMTDLPTPRAVHFWNGIKSLSPVCRHLLTLESLRPLTDTNDEAFFTRFCGIGLAHVYAPAPIRKGFLPGNSRTRTQILEDKTLKVNWQYRDELSALKLTDEATIKLNPVEKIATLQIKPNERVMTIMLGSQGGEAIISYVQQIISLYNQFKNTNPTVPDCMLIVYCGANKNESSPLFKAIFALLKEKIPTQEVGGKLRVFPLGFQNSDVNIAEIAKAASLSINRTGGLATMEMLQCFESVKASDPNTSMEIFIHSEAKNTQDVEEMLHNIPVWERGNAEYLIHVTKAKVLNLETIAAHFIQYLTNIHAEAKNEQNREQPQNDVHDLNVLTDASLQNNNNIRFSAFSPAADDSSSNVEKRPRSNEEWVIMMSNRYKKRRT